MKGNRGNGMGLEHAVAVLVPWWKDLRRCNQQLEGSFFDEEFWRVMSQMRKRVRLQKKGQVK
jgi:hypothetical protein